MSASSDWYSQRPEQDVTLHGILRRRIQGAGPGNRPSLVYELALADGKTVPVYGPTADTKLRGLIGHATALTGKLVDLGTEGFSVELWIGDVGGINATGPNTRRGGQPETRNGPRS